MGVNDGACAFYEAMGGEQFGTRTISIGGEEHEAVGYGWSDLTKLG